MTRKAGSGLHHETANGVEQLTAAIFEGSSIHAASRLVQREIDAGRCGVQLSDLTRWLHDVATHLALPVASAESPSPDHLGDVRLTLTDGTRVWIEVKAQTTKRFTDLTQADWVRDETDSLRYLLLHDTTFAGLQSGWMREALGVYNPESYFGPWGFDGLWLCDVALLTNGERRRAAGVTDLASLGGFLVKKYVLHVTREGVRVVRLDQLQCSQRILSGGRTYLDVAAGGTSDSRIWVSTSGTPSRGRIDFIYYTGYSTSWTVGRHKLNERAVRTANGVFLAM